MKSNINVIGDLDGGKIVVIKDIAFKGRQKIEWSEVEKYLKRFVGEYYSIIETSDMVYIGSDLPDEFSGSNYTKTQNTVGIGMIQNLHFRSIMKTRNWRDSMYSEPFYLSATLRMENCTCMIW